MTGEAKSYVGVVVMAVCLGSLVLIDTTRIGATGFRLVDNSFPESFEEIVSGDRQAFTFGGTLKTPAERLVYRFSYLTAAPVPGRERYKNDTKACLQEIGLLDCLAELWNEPPEVMEASTEIDGESYRFLIYDFTDVLNATGELETLNETLTTFCLMLDNNGTLVGYYKGVSGFLFHDATGAKVYHLSVKCGEEERTYYESGLASAYRTPSLSEGPKLGTVVFQRPRKGEICTVTFTVEASESPPTDMLQIVRVYVDGEMQLCEINPISK